AIVQELTDAQVHGGGVAQKGRHSLPHPRCSWPVSFLSTHTKNRLADSVLAPPAREAERSATFGYTSCDFEVQK
ncbi:MAG TPA: hypothetical protein VFI31_22430, partial [Pirellulales bacterium]|nr:hypothetical protein [Pirellulales bacterium]